MSYKCMITGKVSKHGEKVNKIVAETREKTYTKWVKNEESFQYEEVFVAHGSEIVKELSVSKEGAALWERWSETDRKAFLAQM